MTPRGNALVARAIAARLAGAPVAPDRR